MNEKIMIHSSKILDTALHFRFAIFGAIVSLLFWLNSHLFNFREISSLIFKTMYLKEFFTSLFTRKPKENNECQITSGQHFSIVY